MKRLTSFSRCLKKVLVLDFDSTMTKNDTCTLVPSELSPVKEQWERISRRFMDIYRDCYLENVKSADIFTHLDEVEQIGLSMVEKNLVLKGIKKTDIENLSKKVEFQDDCVELVKTYLESSVFESIHLLSSNWCRYLISSCLNNEKLEYFVVDKVGDFKPKCINIYSNNLEWNDSADETTGKIEKRVTTSSNKLDYTKSFEDSFVVYIGDGMIDVPSILNSEIGILVSPDAFCRDHFSNSSSQLLKHKNVHIVDNWKEISNILKEIQ